MLTTDLARVRIYKGELRPQYIPESRQWLEVAEALISLFRGGRGRPWGILRGELDELVGSGSDAKIVSGLVKLLKDRSTIEADAPIDPQLVRRRLFQRAGALHPITIDPLPGRRTRADLLNEIAIEFDTTPAVLEQSLYADLPEAWVLKDIEDTKPLWLIRRYNVALAQAVFLRAASVEITLAPNPPSRYRQLFRYIRFFRLMYSIVPQDEGFRILLDGPLSLFRLTQKYGLQLAEFLPALLLCSDWRLEARVLWRKDRKPYVFRLDPSAELVSHYPDTGIYRTRIEEWFEKRFSQLRTPWQLHPADDIIPLGGQGILIPDYRLCHPAGHEILLEIIGFWRKDYLQRRIDLYRKWAPPNLILAVSNKLRTSAEELKDFKGRLYLFRETIVPRDLIKIAEEHSLLNSSSVSSESDEAAV